MPRVGGECASDDPHPDSTDRSPHNFEDWTAAQVKAFRLLVNRSVTWPDWDPELLSLEMLDRRNLDYDIDLTGFDTHEIDELLLAQSEDVHENDASAAPENPASRAGDPWLCGPHRILCGDAKIRRASHLFRFGVA
jgi:hypothetical protein